MSDSQSLVTFGPNANCTFELCTIEQSVYGYRPSISANVIFTVLFNLATIIHIILGIKWKTFWFMWCMVLGCTHEVVGYIGRILLYKNPWSFGAFITQIICITQAPVFFCAAIYVMLRQSIDFYSPSLARFPTKFLIWIFLPCDIISLTLQGAGGSLSASSTGTSETGVQIAMAGLVFQVITLFGFCGLFVDWLYRFLRSKHAARLVARDGLFFGFLGLAVLLTLIRCIFRTYELKEGYSGDIITNEGLFIGLEGVLMTIAVFCLFIGHPGFVFTGRRGSKEYSSVMTVESAGESGILLGPQKTEYQGAKGRLA